MKSRVFFEVMRCSPGISACIYVMIYIMAECVNEQPPKSLSRAACEKWRKRQILEAVRRKGDPTLWPVLFQWKEEPTAISTGLSAVEGSISRDCGLCGCSSGHDQPLLKVGWEAEGCLEDVVRCVVFGIKDSPPLIFPLNAFHARRPAPMS
jgi:hypothetical protein